VSRTLFISVLVIACLIDSEAVADGQDTATRVKELFQKETQILDALDTLDRRIVGIAGDEERVRLQHSERKRTVETTRDEIHVVRGRVVVMKERLKKRLRARTDLRLDEAIWRRLLLSAESPNAWIRRREYVRAILRSDLTLLKSMRLDQSALEKLEVTHVAAVKDVLRLGLSLATQRDELESERTLRSEVLRELKDRRKVLKDVLRRRARIRGEVPLPASTDDDDDEILTAKGRLTWPTIGKLSVPFGKNDDEELGTQTQSNGWILSAPHGAPVRAVFPGKVVFSGWYTGYGNLVIIDHGAQHHSLYAHLSSRSIKSGLHVEQGAILGQVGDTGSLRGPQLYFEFRAKRKPINPTIWFERTR
jgi:murein hydrolase activator